MPVSAAITPSAKLLRSVCGKLPKPKESLVAIIVDLLEAFWLKRMIELLGDAPFADGFPQEISSKN